MGFTDKQQALIVFVSALLIALGAISIPANFPYADILTTAFIILGAVGFALKELPGGTGPTDPQALIDAFTASMVKQLPAILAAIKAAQSQPPSP